MKIGILTIVLCCVAYSVAQNTNSSTTTATTPSTTTPTIKEECESRNDNCDHCVKNPKCLWCPTKETKCIPYPASQIIPRKDVCDLGDARWGVCWVNYKVLLIVMGVLAGVLLISFSCCIYCCCCRRKSNRARYAREEATLEREREERRNKHSERRAERQGRMDDIRRKYGLSREEGDGRYKRFENEA